MIQSLAPPELNQIKDLMRFSGHAFQEGRNQTGVGRGEGIFGVGVTYAKRWTEQSRFRNRTSPPFYIASKDNVRNFLPVRAEARSAESSGEEMSRIVIDRLLVNLMLASVSSTQGVPAVMVAAPQVPTGAQYTRANRLREFLREISQGDEQSRLINPRVASFAELAISRLSEAGGPMFGVSVPTASPGPDGQLMLAWRRGDHYLELEIFEEGPWEFFYNDESTDEMFVCEFEQDEPVPAKVAERLRHFVESP